MQTIVIVMNAAKLEDPDLDIRYTLPELPMTAKPMQEV